MADEDDLLDDDAAEAPEPVEEDFDAEDLDEEELDDDALVDDDLVADDLVADDLADDVVADDEALVVVPIDDLETDTLVEDGPAIPAPARPERPATDDEDDDEDVVDPDDVEEDLDTILRDRIAAGTDEEDEDEEVPNDDRTETGDRVSPRRPEEVSCPECFLLVRRSQFSTRRADCPGGLDGADCPMMQVFVGNE